MFELWIKNRIGHKEYRELIKLAQEGRKGQFQWTVLELEHLKQALEEYLKANSDAIHTAGGTHGYTKLMRKIVSSC